MAFSMPIGIFRCLSEGVGYRQYVGVGGGRTRIKANLSSAKLDWTSQLELSLAKVLLNDCMNGILWL